MIKNQITTPGDSLICKIMCVVQLFFRQSFCAHISISGAHIKSNNNFATENIVIDDVLLARLLWFGEANNEFMITMDARRRAGRENLNVFL
jgi:hypothetical protein